MEVKDEIRMKIEKDGVVTVSTDAFSEEAHEEAEQIIKEVFTELGGEKTVKHKSHPHIPHHSHIHVPNR